MRLRYSIIFLLCSLVTFAEENDSISFLQKHFSLNGYVKYMESFSGDTSGNVFTQGLLHNRLNSKVFINNNNTIYLELRNRVFWGESIKMNPFILKGLKLDDGVMDLSWAGGENKSFLWSSKIDRLWYSGTFKSWDWSVGRQRINWGINSFWNSNDLFNAFNFTDFDYEERPGSDAVRVQKYFKDFSSIEIAVAAYQNNRYVSALKYAFNKWEYDFQIIAAKYFNDYTLGVGWAGAIKNVGFKGEASYFQPENIFSDTNGVASVSISFEYLLKGGQFLSIGGLYNSSGIASKNQFGTNLLGFQTSAKYLMPTRWSSMLAYGDKINDLSSYNLVLLYTPGIDMFLLMPSLSYSVAQNWDLSLFALDFLTNYNNEWINGANVFGRLKFSF